MADFTALRGIVCPVVSPCTSNEGVDYDSLQENLARLLRAPITGFYVCGGTGDGSRLTFAERCRTAELTIVRQGPPDAGPSSMSARRFSGTRWSWQSTR